MVRSTPEPPVAGSTVILVGGNSTLLFVVTVTVNESPTSISAGVTLTMISSPSSSTAAGSTITARTGVSLVLATVITKSCVTVVSESLT